MTGRSLFFLSIRSSLLFLDAACGLYDYTLRTSTEIRNRNITIISTMRPTESESRSDVLFYTSKLDCVKPRLLVRRLRVLPIPLEPRTARKILRVIIPTKTGGAFGGLMRTPTAAPARNVPRIS